MRCPHCGYGEDKVTDSRPGKKGIRRRRECSNCGQRFTTMETVVDEGLFVIKKNGRRERFDSGKLLAGLYKACEKRHPPLGSVESIAYKVESILRSWGGPEVSSSDIGRLVLAELRELDQIAYLRFASVYLGFSSLEDLQAEIEAMRGQKESPVADRQTTLWPAERMEDLTRRVSRFPTRRKPGFPKGEQKSM